MSVEMLWAYEEYCVDCQLEGRQPLSLERWLYGVERE